MLLPLLLAQRWLHREIQWVLLLITRRPNATVGLFSLLFFPGVLLHEFSHFLMANFLQVRTGHFSLLPELTPDRKLRLGYVETEQADILRDALIGAAPLLSGGLAVAYLGTGPLGFVPLAAYAAQGDWVGFWDGLFRLPQQPDFWVWFYLAFTISSTMLPSASDRRGWLPIALVLVVTLALALLAGAGPWMLENIAPHFNRVLRAVAMVFGVSLALHIALLLPFRLLRALIEKITGLQIVAPQGD